MLLFLHGRPEHSVCVPAALSPLVADNAQISNETAVWARNLNIFPCSFTEPVNGVWSEALNKVNAQPRTNSTSLIAARVYMCFHRYRPSSQVGPSFGPQAHSPQATWTGEHSSSLVVHHCAGRSLLCSGLRSSLHSRSQTLLSVESLPLPLVEGSPLLIPARIY